MQALSRSTFILLLGVFSMFASARTSSAQESKKENRASITGRVTLEGKPVPRVTVILTSSDRYMSLPQSAPTVRATTDEDGRYRLTGLSAGSYAVSPNVPAFVVAEERVGQLGQTISLLEGEEAEDINFTLKQGGVITGRITDAEGKPIIGGRVNLMQVDEQGRTFEKPYANGFRFMTDDRGVYRVYGLQPGRYKVSSGDSADGRLVRPSFAGGGYPRTFHPGVADPARSPIVEVTAGNEATGIDITVGRVSRSYAASGRFIDAATGAPVANIQFGYGTLPDQKHIMSIGGGSGNKTNANGEFRIDSLPSGRFAVFLLGQEESEFYSEPAVFEVADSDVSGLEIKLQRGSTISGVAVIEGTEDPDVLAKLSKLEIRAWVQSESMSQPSYAPAKFGVNGSFRLIGLQPGKVYVSLSSYPPVKGLSLLRVEREGVEQTQGIEVGPGEQVSGVRLVIANGTGIIRGQVRFQGGERPPSLRMYASIRRIGGVMTAAGAEVDARGRFKVEDLPFGEYEVMLAIQPQPGDRGPTAKPQKVTVVSGSEAEVTFVLNLKPAGKDGVK